MVISDNKEFVHVAPLFSYITYKIIEDHSAPLCNDSLVLRDSYMPDIDMRESDIFWADTRQTTSYLYGE